MTLCVAQIVLFSGKVEIQHSSPEIWLPGERGGKERKRKQSESEQGREGCSRVQKLLGVNVTPRPGKRILRITFESTFLEL